MIALATLLIALTSWYWLSRSNQILKELHDTTIQQVNRSHELTKQSSVFTTSAPFLLNFKSPYIVNSEGLKLLDSIDSAISAWHFEAPNTVSTPNQSYSIIATLKDMRQLMEELISDVQKLASQDDHTRRHVIALSLLEKQLIAMQLETPDIEDRESIQQAQIVSNLLIAASHANSFLSLGEYRRRFVQSNSGNYRNTARHEVKQAFLAMETLAQGEGGLFNTRYKTLQHSVSTHRALDGIRAEANKLNELVLTLIRESEADIASRREATSIGIEYAIVLVGLIGLISICVAALSLVYISGYVIKNLKTVSTTMTALAKGNLALELPVGSKRQDEIGELHSAFQVFHANALNLNTLNKQLIQKTALFESTFNNINDGIALVSADHRMLAMNPKLNQLLSLFGKQSEAAIGCNFEECISAIAQSTRNQKISYANPETGYRELHNSLGQVVEVRTNLLPDGGSVWLFSDTTERRRVEEKLHHFQRLESLGQLTGEVAHDVNNILSAVRTTIPSVLSNRAEKEIHKHAVERIEEAVELGSSLTQRLLAFAKKQQLKPRTIELNELIKGVTDLIALSLGEAIKLKITLYSKLVYVNIDPMQLESALLNLCINSARAIEVSGVVSIQLQQDDNHSATISVADTGCGMTDEVLRRAVEPFFSTNRGSSGSGLGLSIVYGFMKQSGGDMQILSSPGTGTTVSLRMNTIDFETRTDRPSRIENQSNTNVLIVEDDLTSLKRASRYLTEIGLQPLEAPDYDSALVAIKSNRKIAVLFTDLYLDNKQSGWDIARIFLESGYAEKIIVTSGRISKLAFPPVDLQHKIQLLEKPYTINSLRLLLLP